MALSIEEISALRAAQMQEAAMYGDPRGMSWLLRQQMPPDVMIRSRMAGQQQQEGFSFVRAGLNFVKGAVVDTISGMFSLKGLATMALAGGAIALTGGAALPFIAAAGIAMGGFQFIKSGIDAGLAYSEGRYRDSENAFRGMGSGAASLGLSIFGARAGYKAGKGKLTDSVFENQSASTRAETVGGTLKQLYLDITGQAKVRHTIDGHVHEVSLFRYGKNEFMGNLRNLRSWFDNKWGGTAESMKQRGTDYTNEARGARSEAAQRYKDKGAVYDARMKEIQYTEMAAKQETLAEVAKAREAIQTQIDALNKQMSGNSTGTGARAVRNRLDAIRRGVQEADDTAIIDAQRQLAALQREMGMQTPKGRYSTLKGEKLEAADTARRLSSQLKAQRQSSNLLRARYEYDMLQAKLKAAYRQRAEYGSTRGKINYNARINELESLLQTKQSAYESLYNKSLDTPEFGALKQYTQMQGELSRTVARAKVTQTAFRNELITRYKESPLATWGEKFNPSEHQQALQDWLAQDGFGKDIYVDLVRHHAQQYMRPVVQKLSPIESKIGFIESTQGKAKVPESLLLEQKPLLEQMAKYQQWLSHANEAGSTFGRGAAWVGKDFNSGVLPIRFVANNLREFVAGGVDSEYDEYAM